MEKTRIMAEESGGNESKIKEWAGETEMKLQEKRRNSEGLTEFCSCQGETRSSLTSAYVSALARSDLEPRSTWRKSANGDASYSFPPPSSVESALFHPVQAPTDQTTAEE